MRPKIVPNSNRILAESLAEKGYRLNGRAVEGFRKAQMNFGKSFGSCEVILEPGTRVFSQISASIGEPMDSRPGEGILTVSTWISPTATSEMAGGGPGSQKPALIARTIERVFKEHRVVDLESLCIKFGEKVWVLRIDVHLLDTNGCLTEASILSVLGGLLTFKRPQAHIEVNTDELIVYSIYDAIPVKLRLNHLPILTSFCLTEGKKILAEPDSEEEDIFPGKVVIGINDSKELCYMHLINPISHEVLTEATRLARLKCLERIKWIKDIVMEHEEKLNIPIYQRKEDLKIRGKVIDLSERLSQNQMSRSLLLSDIKIEQEVDTLPNSKMSKLVITENQVPDSPSLKETISNTNSKGKKSRSKSKR